MKKLCADMAMAMYRAGRCDREIAQELGYSRVAITNWRKAHGLPANWSGRPMLTPEQLREMEGEPVYLSGVGLDRWDIFCGLSTNGLACFLLGAFPMAGCGKTWAPYRRRPGPGSGRKEEANETD